MSTGPIRIGRHWHFADGTVLPVVSGGDGPTDPPSGDAGSGGGAPSTPAPAATAPVAAPAATSAPATQPPAVDEKRIRTEATKAANEALAKDLGVSVEDAKKIIGAQQAADAAKLSEAEKREQAAATAEAAANSKLANATVLERRLVIREALMNAGAASLDDATFLVERELGSDADTIEKLAESIDAVKARVPAMFAAGGAPAAGAPSGAPAQQPPGAPTGGALGVEAGRAAARAKRDALTNSDPFGGLTPIGAAPAITNSN